MRVLPGLFWVGGPSGLSGGGGGYRINLARYRLVGLSYNAADRAGLSESKRAACEDDRHGEEVFDGCTAHVNPRLHHAFQRDADSILSPHRGC